MRFVIRGNQINFTGEVATPTANMLVAKILFNGVVSTKGARFMTMDISNFYLNTPLKGPKYIYIKLNDIQDEVIGKYKLQEKADRHGNVYSEATKGKYGLPQSGLLTNQLLKKSLNKYEYY